MKKKIFSLTITLTEASSFFIGLIVLVFMNGLLLGFSLIISLGPQNIFLIRQGALRQNALLAAIICTFCDCILIIGSILGLHAFIQNFPQLEKILYWIGILFLLSYGLRALRSAIFKKKEVIFKPAVQPRRIQIIFIAVGFSILNPHAIIDSLIIIGANSTAYQAHLISFSTGVMTASILWFGTITSIAFYFAGGLTRPHIWRYLESTSGALMLFIAYKLYHNLILL